jgi:anti-anti-sigma regulatory factor
MTAAARRGEVVLVVARGMTQVDATGAEMLVSLAGALGARGLGLVLAEVNAPVRRELEAAGLEGVRMFESLSEAVALIERDGREARPRQEADVIPGR